MSKLLKKKLFYISTVVIFFVVSLYINVNLTQAVSKKADFYFKNVTIGTKADYANKILGGKSRVDKSIYGFDWYIFNKNYNNYIQLGVKNGIVIGMYSNSKSMCSKTGIKIGSTKDSVRKVFGNPLKSILKGNTYYSINSENEYDVFDTNDTYTTIFYDKFNKYKVTAVKIVSKAAEQALSGFYAVPNAALRNSYEKEVFDISNAIRVRNGLKAFIYDTKASNAARKHAVDMEKNNYFSHYNLKGEGPDKRMNREGIKWRSEGENIATGQQDAIFAVEGWMNSEGHRENILTNFQHLGVGVAFNSQKQPFYVQDFYTPL